MNARITLIGMERTLNRENKSITDTWSIDNEHFDKDILLSAIITKGGRFEPLYTSPDYYYEMCDYWFKKWNRTFTKWFNVFDKEYEPLWDRNGFESIHEDTHDVLDNDTTYTKNGSIHEVMDDDTTGSSSTNSHSVTENTVSAFNSSSYQPHDKSETTANSSESNTGTDDRITDTTINERGTGTNDSDNDRDFDRDYHSWGNWGISQTSQKLLESELKVQYWNCYNHIADIFCDEMLIRVY